MPDVAVLAISALEYEACGADDRKWHIDWLEDESTLEEEEVVELPPNAQQRRSDAGVGILPASKERQQQQQLRGQPQKNMHLPRQQQQQGTQQSPSVSVADTAAAMHEGTLPIRSV